MKMKYVDTWRYECAIHLSLSLERHFTSETPVDGCLIVHADMWLTPPFFGHLRANHLLNHNRDYWILEKRLETGLPKNRRPLTSANFTKSRTTGNWTPPLMGWHWPVMHQRVLQTRSVIEGMGIPFYFCPDIVQHWVDLFYIPRKKWILFAKIFQVFSIEGVMNEVAVPAAMCISGGGAAGTACFGGCCTLASLEDINLNTCGHKIAMQKEAHRNALLNWWLNDSLS
jgi:hypothetical protein